MSDNRVAWDKENTVSVTLKFNKRTDADIIAALAAQPNKQKYIKDLVRKEINMTVIYETKRADEEINYNAAVDAMDDEIREALHSELAPCSEQEFFNAYVAAHKAKYGEDFLCDENGRLCW